MQFIDKISKMLIRVVLATKGFPKLMAFSLYSFG